jgi:glycosyltransferase involved in cell wall biosynthesis
MISAIVHTYNEEHNIANALGSLVDWVDEIIVADMASTDRTVEIAKSFGASIRHLEHVGYVEPAREAVLLSASYDWVVLLDADEMIPVELSRYLKKEASADTADYYMVPRLNYMFGMPILHSGWGPDQDRQPRFFRKNAVVFSNYIHAGMRPKDGVRVKALSFRKSKAIIHFNYLDSSHFLTKLDRYTSIEGSTGARDGKPANLAYLCWRGVREFLLRFFLLQGFRDGWVGYYLAVLMVLYKTVGIVKVMEIRQGRTSEDLRGRYNKIANDVLMKYRAG